MQTIEARARELTIYLIEEAEQRQIRMLTPRPWEERAGIVALQIAENADGVEARLKEGKTRVAAKDDHMRAAIHFYNRKQDIDCYIDGLTTL